MSQPSLDQRVAATTAQASRLRHAAILIRRHAGGLTYHPMTGARARPSPVLTGALFEIDEIVTDLQRGTEERAQEEFAATATGDTRAEGLRAGYGAIAEAAQVVLAALQVLRAVLRESNGATVDAPYGHSAPTRHHPGALCTIVAERVEALAQALETVTIMRVNLERTRPAADA